MQPHISMIALGVADLAKAIAFYQKGLGLPKIDSPPSVAFFDLNGTWLGLSPREDLAKDAGVSTDGHGYSAVHLAHNVSSETAVDQVLKQATDAGATLVKPAIRAAWGGYHGYFADLDGHIWEVAHNPFLQVGPKADE
ncbi:MAG: VOC family protein [Paracoccaceae bacterium]